jgi:CheY-like chemotaxis protein
MIRGHTVEVAQDGESALKLFAACQPDLVVTDFSLPGMDGLELAQAIRQASPNMPIILITAYAEAVHQRTGPVSNIDVLLSKPFSAEELQAALGKLFPAG